MVIDKIFITNIETMYTNLVCDDRVKQICITGYNVRFILYDDIEGKLTINTNKEMELKEIREYIRERIYG